LPGLPARQIKFKYQNGTIFLNTSTASDPFKLKLATEALPPTKKAKKVLEDLSTQPIKSEKMWNLRAASLRL